MNFLSRNKFFNRYLPMLLSVVLLVAALGAYLFINKSAPPAQATWYSTSWTNRMPITIDHAKVSTVNGTTLSGFPALISLTNGNLRTLANGGSVASSSGADILFTSGDGATQIPYERESYSSTTGALLAWVNISSLSPTVDTNIYMYYGNATAGLADQQQPGSVWDSNYDAVYHLKETLTGNNQLVYDSTSNTVNATSTAYSGNIWSGSQQIPGKIGGSLNFNGGTYLVASSTLLRVASTTVEAWVNTTTAGNAILTDGSPTNPKSGNIPYALDATSTGQAEFFVRNGATTYSATSTASIIDGNWHHVAGTYDGSTMRLYVDGALAGTNTNYSGSLPLVGILDLGSSANSLIFNGQIDEIRVSGIARSPDWIKTEFNNQSNPAAFISLGNQQSSSQPAAFVPHEALSSRSGAAVWNGAAWTSRKKLIINHEQVSGTTTPLTNFPVLVNLTDADWKTVANGGHVASTTGADIFFTASDATTTIPYERESYASTTGALVAWVKVPSVSPTIDTSIYIYYGNSSNGLADQQNSTAVWDSNYQGVWHLASSGGSTTNGTVTFATATSTQSWTVPAGVTSITVKAWGAGGAGGSNSSHSGGAGGGGGFAQATVSVTAGAALNVYVGGGGVKASTSGGGGGGYSAVTNGATYLVQAGGGGGGGASGNGPDSTSGSDGGAGGGSSGVAGTTNGGITGGGAGTPSTFGSGGSPNGTNGSANQGGQGGSSPGGAGGTNGGGAGGLSNGSGGGGGGGKYGGGGGGSSGTPAGGAGGGGGSDLVTGSGTVETAGSGTAPGNTGDSAYTGSVGVGGAAATNGNDGYVVITYQSVTGGTLSTTDSTSNGNNGTNSGVTATAGQIDGAGSFDGSTSGITYSGVSVGATATLEAWVNQNSLTGYQNVFANGSSKGIWMDGGKTDMYSGGDHLTNTAVTINTWNQIVVVQDGTNINFYLNGIYDGSSPDNAFSYTANGTGKDAGAGTEQFHGMIDELRSSNSIRSAAWIKTEYNNQSSPSNFVYIGQRDTTVRASNTPTLKARGHVKFR